VSQHLGPRSRRHALIAAVAWNSMISIALVLGSISAAGAADAGRRIAADAVAKEHDEAVALARRGNLNEALATLERLAREHPDDLGVAGDRIVILTWAGRDAEAAQRYEQLPPGDRPDYVIEAAARAYRNLHRYTEALALYRAGEKRFPHSAPLAAGEIEALADGGEAKAGLARAEEILARQGDALPTLLAAAYAARPAGAPVDSLRYADRALKLDARNREALRQRVLAIEAIGAPDRALALARAEPGLLSTAEVRRLEGSAAAQLVRWDEIEPAREAERFATADRAIATLDALIERWSNDGDDARDVLLRARFDRIVALHDRVRMREVVSEYENLSRSGVTAPDYVLTAVAAAYLYLHEPETARDLYRRAVAADPGDIEAQLGLFHALIEAEQFDEALQHVDGLAARLAPRVRLRGESEPRANPDKLEADRAAASARLFADALPGAEDRFEAMSDRAPNNAGLLVGLANVYAARGWPRRAADMLQTARAQQPLDAGVEIAQANLDLELQEWRRFDGTVADLGSRLPENLDVQRLEVLRQLHDNGELQLSVDRTFRSVTGVNGGNGLTASAQIYSPPLAYDLRTFAGTSLAHERLPEGALTERLYDAGLEYRGRDLTATAETHLAAYGTERGGGRLAAIWTPSDYWRFGSSGEIFSADTPLRALRHGVTANALNANLGFVESESREIKATAQEMFFSDGNYRTGLGTEWRERLYTTPHLRITGVAALGGSHNSRTDAPYYNPRYDSLGTAGIDVSQILYRRYEFTYEHGVVASAGAYWEQGFGTGLAWSTRYEQRIKSDEVQAALGLGFARQSYDRVYENDITLSFNLTWRF
jgi:biofilm PGA synthesis protein PgaA